jgi:pantoate--beta-alanine ligase
VDQIEKIASVRERIRTEKRKGKVIGFVPTMGYLHDGHLSLVRCAAMESDFIVVSIFVNPIQFGEGEDYDRYPRDIERDVRLIENAGGDLLFIPKVEEIYPEGYCTHVEVEGVTSRLCGKYRPTHFRGVTTVVTKLFNIVQPDLAVFGQKDAQQAVVIQRLIRDLNYPIELIVAPIVRDDSGLALSSRNRYLSPEEREDAKVLNQSLRLAQRLVDDGKRDVSLILDELTAAIRARPSTRIQYVEIVDPVTLEAVEVLEEGTDVLLTLAVYAGDTRLIDNALIRVGETNNV